MIEVSDVERPAAAAQFPKPVQTVEEGHGVGTTGYGADDDTLLREQLARGIEEPLVKVPCVHIHPQITPIAQIQN